MLGPRCRWQGEFRTKTLRKKRGSRRGSLDWTFAERILEGDLHSEIQLSHRCVWRKAGDQPRTGAVDAVIWIIEIHVIEDVKRFKPELCSNTLRDSEVLK